MKSTITQRLLVVAIVVLTSLTAGAQTDSYRKAMAAFIQSNGVGLKKEGLLHLYSGMTIEAIPDMSTGEATEIAKKYMEERYDEDIIDILCVYFDSLLTEKDLKSLTAMYESKEGKRTLANREALDGIEEKVMQMLAPNMHRALEGKKINYAKPDDPLPSYRKAWVKYSKLANRQDVYDNLIKGVMQNCPEEMMEEGKRVEEYMRKDMPICDFNAHYWYVKEEDLLFYISVYSSKPGKEMIKLQETLRAHNDDFSESLNEKYVQWLHEKYFEK